MANNSIVADIVLQFKIDGKSEAEIKRALQKLDRDITSSGLGGKDIAALRQQIAGVIKGLDDTSVAANKAGASIRGLSQGVSGFALIALGNKLGQFGQSVLAPMKAYEAAAGKSGEFAVNMERVQAATVRIGQAQETALLPLLKEEARLAEKIAEIFEANPALATASVVVGKGSEVLAKISSLVGTVLIARAFLQQQGIGGAAAAGEAAGGAGGAAGGLSTGALGLIGAAGLIYHAALASTFTALGEKIFNPIFVKFGTSIDEFQAAVKSKGLSLLGLGQGAAAGAPIPSEGAVNAYSAFLKAQAAAEKQYEDQRTAIVTAAGQQRAQIEATYEQTRTNLLATFAQQSTAAAVSFTNAQLQAEAEYYRSRSELASQYNLQVQRAEEDHQRDLKKLRRSYLAERVELEGQRDAIGIVLAKRRYDQQRDDLEDEYRLEARRRSQDFAIRLAEMEQQFQIQRAQRYADYQQQQLERAEQLKLRLAEAEAAKKAELSKLSTSTAEKLRALQKAYNDERIQRVNALNDQLRDLGVFLGAEYQTKAQVYAAELALLQSYLAQIQSQGGAIAGRASGGDVKAGRAYIVGERRPELFVPRESGHIYPSVGAGGVSVTNNIRFSGEVTSTSRREIEKIVRVATTNAIAGAVKG